MVWNRASGAFSRQRITNAFTSGGTSITELSSGGSSCMCFSMRSKGFLPTKGVRPDMAAKRTAPSEYTSLRESMAFRACSGAMYRGDPSTTPSSVSSSSACDVSALGVMVFTSPKSSTLTRSPSGPSGRSMMFEGLRSRCTSPS